MQVGPWARQRFKDTVTNAPTTSDIPLVQLCMFIALEEVRAQAKTVLQSRPPLDWPAAVLSCRVVQLGLLVSLLTMLGHRRQLLRFILSLGRS